MWHGRRKTLLGGDDLEQPNFKRQYSEPADHKMKSNLEGADLKEAVESMRYDGVRIYCSKEDALEKFRGVQFLSGFMVPLLPDGIVLVPYTKSQTMANCVIFITTNRKTM